MIDINTIHTLHGSSLRVYMIKALDRVEQSGLSGWILSEVTDVAVGELKMQEQTALFP